MTWAELLKIIDDYGFSREEYFGRSPDTIDWSGLRVPIWEESQEKYVRWVSVYWVVGSAEGYWVHVDVIFQNHQREGRLLGKFWKWESAQAAVNFIQYVVNMGRVPADAKPLGDE